MDTKKLAIMIAIGLALGLTIGFPLARLAQPVKTRTVTRVTISKSVIQNGINLVTLLSSFGTAVGRSQTASAANNWVSCIDYRGPASATSTPKVGDWTLTICAKIQ